MANNNVFNEDDSDSDSDCGELVQGTPPELRAIANEASKELLPEASKHLYEAEYENYKQWCQENRVNITSENVLLVYFHNMATKFAPPTLWRNYSFLKGTIKLHENLDISKFTKIQTFLGRKSKRYKKKKATPFTEEELQMFFHTAPDCKWFVIKVIMVFGIMGALRVCEIVNIRMHDVEDKGDLYFVRIPDTKTGKEKSFTIHNDFYDIVKRYFALRPKDVPHNRVFLNYQNERCTVQPIGKNKIAKMPLEIATFLNLDTKVNRYTGHSIRRTSASIVGNSGASTAVLKRLGGWASETVAESYVEESINSKNETANIIASKINVNLQAAQNRNAEPISSTSAMKRKNVETDNRILKTKRTTTNSKQPSREATQNVPNKIGKFTFKTPKYCHLPPPPRIPSPSPPPPMEVVMISQGDNNNLEVESEFSNYVIEEFESPFSPSPSQNHSLSQYIIEEEITQTPTNPVFPKQCPYNFNFNNCTITFQMNS